MTKQQAKDLEAVILDFDQDLTTAIISSDEHGHEVQAFVAQLEPYMAVAFTGFAFGFQYHIEAQNDRVAFVIY